MSIETRAITLQDGKTVDQLRQRYGHVSASHAFASLFIWQEEMKLSIYLEDRLFAVKCGCRGKNTWFFPCGEPARMCCFLRELKTATSDELRLCYMREEDVALVEEEFPEQFLIWERPEDHEYLYSREEQEKLSGRRFATQRNHIHRAEADHTLQSVPLNDETAAAALEIQHAWHRSSNEPTDLCDDTAAKLLLRHRTQLDVCGIVVLMDGEPYALAAGYPLSRDTFDLALAKQKNTLSGLSAYTKHALIQSLPEQFTCINAEEDLGLDGLRTMKRQMRPTGRIKMFEGRLLPCG